jgi:hypothetical protein
VTRKDEYAAKLAEYEAALAEFNSKADKLELAERALVKQSNEDDANRRLLLRRYDEALEARDEEGIAAYMAEAETLRIRYVERKAALAAVREEFRALERERPRPPRRTWREFLGLRRSANDPGLGYQLAPQARQPYGKLKMDDKAKLQLAELIAKMLNTQVKLYPDLRIVNPDGGIKRKAVGYIYGYTDAVLQTMNLEMRDIELSAPILFHIFRKIFPSDDAFKAMNFLVDNLHDEAVAFGIMHGGQQYLDYRKPDAKGVPMGLARFMLEENRNFSRSN